MKFKIIVALLLLCLLTIGSVNASDNLTDDIISLEQDNGVADASEMSTEHKEVNDINIDENEAIIKETNAKTEDKNTKLKSSDDKQKFEETNYLSVTYYFGHTITEGDGAKIIMKNGMQHNVNYFSIYIDDNLYKKITVTNDEITEIINGLTVGQHKITIGYYKEAYGEQFFRPYNVTVNPKPTSYTTTKSTTSQPKKTVKYQMKKVKKGKTYKYGKYKGKFTKKQRNSIINAKNKGKYKTVTVNTGKIIKYKYYTYKKKTKYKTFKFGHNVQTFEEEALAKKGWTRVTHYWWGKKTYWDPNLGYWNMVYGKFKKVTYVKVKKYHKYKIKMSLSTYYTNGRYAVKNKAILRLSVNGYKIKEKPVKI